ncbi:MAG: DEAD/DEAH box helicase [Elainella sp.]
MSFSTLGLSDALLRAVQERGYTTPTPIQTQAIPAVLAGGDLLAAAQTGTGKTAGFTLPILQRLATQTHHKSEAKADSPPGSTQPGRPVKRVVSAQRSPVRALILTPTRELAAQVETSVRDYGKYLDLSSITIFGGVAMQPQIRQLRGRVDILVATPGRLLDHVQQGTVDLSHVEILVLDEADRMLDMGFIKDIRRILDLLPRHRQNLLFSATFSDELKQLAASFLQEPTLIETARRNATADTVAQKVYRVDRERKRQLLVHLIQQHNWYQVLVFTRTKHGADRLVKQLGHDRIQALAIHGNKSQAARTRALAKFKEGSLQVLVATDIAARGLDISELPHVVNFDLPNVPEDYVHRIGRTGRAGIAGEAISLVCVDEHKLLRDIETLIKQSLPQEFVSGFEPDPTIAPQPIPNGRNQAQRSQGRPGRSGQSGRSGSRPDGRPDSRPEHQRSEHKRSSQRQDKRRPGSHSLPK